MAELKIKRLVSVPGVLEASTLYITKNAANAALVDLTFVGTSITDVRRIYGEADVQSAIAAAIAGLTADDIPDLPGTKITSTLSVDTTGNAATATLADRATVATTADALSPGATINGVEFTGAAPITISAEDTETPRVAVADIGVTVAPVVDGKIPAQYVPASFDQIDEFPTLEDFPEEGVPERIYIAMDSGVMYRWTGTSYVAISSGAGIVDEAIKLVTPRNISVTGDATGTTIVGFDGTANVSIPLVLKDTGTAGVQQLKVTTDAQGRVISSTAATADDIPDLPGTKIISTLSVDTTGNAATATYATTAGALEITAEW